MRRLAAFLVLFSSSCTTLDVLSGDEATNFRAVYVKAGVANVEASTVDSTFTPREVDENAATLGVELSYRILPRWTSDLMVEVVNTDDPDLLEGNSYLVSAGIRYFFVTEGQTQPYFGVGLASVRNDLERVGDETWLFGSYARVGVDFDLGDWRIGPEIRPIFIEDQYDQIVLGLNVGWEF